MEKLSFRNSKGLRKSSLGIMTLSVLALALGGCGSSEKRPDAEITQATTIVDQSERAGSRNYAAFDLVNAKNKLTKANELLQEGEYKKARYLATEAGVDAELATAKTQAAKAKEAEEQLMKSMQTLEKEINPGQ